MFVTQVQFDQLKQRYQDYKDEGFPGIDKRMIRIVTKLNEFDDITTVFCCEGHYGQLTEWLDEFLLRMNIIMAVRSMAGLNTLYSIIERINSQLATPFGMRITIGQLVWPLCDNGELYPIVSLEKSYRIYSKEEEDSVKIRYLFALSNAIDYVKENQKCL